MTKDELKINYAFIEWSFNNSTPTERKRILAHLERNIAKELKVDASNSYDRHVDYVSKLIINYNEYDYSNLYALVSEYLDLYREFCNCIKEGGDYIQ